MTDPLQALSHNSTLFTLYSEMLHDTFDDAKNGKQNMTENEKEKNDD